MSEILSVNNLSFSYKKNSEILKNISFEVYKGDVLSVIGPNGAGKTTLFKCLLGQLKPATGSILVDGLSVADISDSFRAGKMAYIPQLTSLVFDYSVLDTVLMGTVNSLGVLSVPGRTQYESAREAMALVGIERLSERKMSELSGGEKQLVYIARAIAQKADILIMDEPTSSLDYGNQIKIMNVISALGAQGYSVLISMHNPKVARKYSTKTLAIFEGSIKAFGTSGEIITEEFINDLYSIE